MMGPWRKRDERGIFASVWRAINELGAYCDSLRIMPSATVRARRTSNGTTLEAAGYDSSGSIVIAAQVNEGTDEEPDWVWKKIRVRGSVVEDAPEAGVSKWA